MSRVFRYTCYDDSLEPRGQPQEMGYLEHLAKGRPNFLRSFEKLRTETAIRAQGRTVSHPGGRHRLAPAPLEQAVVRASHRLGHRERR